MTKLSLLLPFLLLNCLPTLATAQSNDRSILLTIKKQWGNPDVLSTWNSITTTSHCNWDGIQCSSSSTTPTVVTGISLSNYSISGSFPPSICNLQHLTYLDLSWNLLPGTFPTSLYNCTSLTHLDLSQNLLVGPLPHEIGNKLSPSLQHLDFTGNNFTGDIPSSISQLTELRTLSLMQMLLNGTYPPEIGNLTNLENLCLAYNPFTDLILRPEIGRLRNLKYLRMNDCNLVGEIPKTFEELTSLVHLDLINNSLTGSIPKGLFGLKNLTLLYLYKNKLSGQLPSGSIELPSLTEIDVSHNNLTGSIPDDFVKLKRLQVLNLFNNQLTGELPAGIGLLPELREVKLFVNKFSGPLPAELGLRSKLKQLEIFHNQFSGPLPENLCYNGAFIGVTAYSNNLSGEVPKSLGNCKTLRTLQLFNNSFTGEIPSAIWTLPDLYSLQLSFNSFTGRLPQSLSWNLTRLEIDNNEFTGDIPSTTSQWTNLHVFHGSNNRLTGSIPPQLTSLSTLEQLSLDGNKLSGTLPTKTSTSSWKSLTSLNLARNQLSGSIPSSLSTLPVLSYLDLSTNDLSGEIPPQLGKLNLNYLNLSNNQLTGQIPSSLDNMAYENSFLNNTHLCTAKGNLISTLPRCSSSSTMSSRKQLSSKYLAVILLLAVLAFLVTLYLTFYAIKELRHRRVKSNNMMEWKLTSFQRRLDFTEETIVSRLSDHNVVGSGGSGQVYRVGINRLGDAVAVKKIWNNRKIDDDQFIAEVQTLGTIRHSNIVKLLCCISSDEAKLLVYEYMENQSLDKWIHNKDRRRDDIGNLFGETTESSSISSSRRRKVELDWPARLRIAIGAAQGLCYMHHDCSPPIIHRDVKSSNILLDSEFNAKIADFGLAKISVNKGEPNTMSAVAGSFGYFAPEYRYTRKVNEKVDVYSFGVVLLELVTGKEPNKGNDSLNLADWSWKHYSDHQDDDIVIALDQDVVQPCYVEEMSNVFKLGLMCTSSLPTSRPSMKEVLQVLSRCHFLAVDGSSKIKVAGKKELDVTPLLGSGDRVPSCRKSGSRRAEQDDEFSMV